MHGHNEQERWTKSWPNARNVVDVVREVRLSLEGAGLAVVNLNQGEVIQHPVGTLRVCQKSVPLDLDIDKIGDQKAGEIATVTVTREHVTLQPVEHILPDLSGESESRIRILYDVVEMAIEAAMASRATQKSA